MSTIQTRQQREMALALSHIRVVQDQLSETEAKTYGSLCLKLPVLVQTNGLCQTLAFLEDKGKDNTPYQMLLDHIAELLDLERRNLLDRVREASMMEYIRLSRQITSAWTYYKRFSGSILGVQVTDDGEDG